MDSTRQNFSPKSQAWKKYKDDRREREQAIRLFHKRQEDELRKAIAAASAEGKVLVRPKSTPYYKYKQMIGGRAAARNAEFKRPAVGNRKVHHQKWQAQL